MYGYISLSHYAYGRVIIVLDWYPYWGFPIGQDSRNNKLFLVF